MLSRLLLISDFSFSTNSSSEELVNQAIRKLCNPELHRGGAAELLTDEQIIPVIIEHIKFLCEILTPPSFDIVTCEKLLISFCKIFYCDYHGSRMNREWQGKCVYGILKYIRRRVSDALQVKRKSIIFNDEVTLYLLNVYRYSKFTTYRF